MGERGKAEVVEGAAVVAILGSSVGASGSGLFLDFRDINAEAMGVVADDSIPDVARPACAAGNDGMGLSASGLTLAPRVISEGNRLHVVVAGDVFRAGHEAVVVAVEVDILIPSHFAECGH